jgi:hypothetical protein
MRGLIHTNRALLSDGAAAVALPAVVEPAPLLRADLQGAALVRADRQAGPPPRHLAIANERWQFLRRCEDLKQSGEARSDHQAAALVRLTASADFPTLGRGKLNHHNLRKWSTNLGTHANGQIAWDNRDALLPRWTIGRRERDGDARFWPIFAGFYESGEQFSLSTAYEFALMSCRHSGIADLPRLHQVRHYYKHPDIRMRAQCARRGPEWARNRVVGHITRTWDAVAPNDVWIGDHHQYDAMIKVPEGAGWRPVRPWISAWLDGRSLAIIGWCITAEAPNHRTILEALRNGILLNRLHCAAGLLTDRGSDFRLQGFTTPWTCEYAPGLELSSLADLGCSARASNAYNARAKTIERIFGVVCGMFTKLMASYRGRNPIERPDKANYYSQHPEELPTLGQFSKTWEEWLAKIYHQRHGKGRILKGHSPAEVWTPGTGGPLLDVQSLRLGLAVPVACPVVRAGGCVVYKGADWRSSDLWPYIGSRVILRVDPVNRAAFACDLKGRLIGELELKRLVHALAGGADLEAEMREQAIQRKALTAAIDEATAGTYGLAGLDRLQIDWSRAVEIEKKGQVRSVTGPAHLYRHLAAIQDGKSTSLATLPEIAGAVPETRRPQHPHDRADAALLERLLSGRDSESAPPAEPRQPDAAHLALLADINLEGFRT